MSTSSLDCALEALPYEIKLVIIAHLAPTSSSPAASLRSHAYLSGLGRASPALYYDLESVVNSSINITERAQVARLVDLAPERIRHQVRTAQLGRVTPPWLTAELDLLAQSLPQLTELRIRGGVDGNKRELLESLRGLPLERLEVDFGPSPPPSRRIRSVQQKQATLPWNARADPPFAVPGDADASEPVRVHSRETASDVLAGRSVSDGPCTCLSLKLRAPRDVTCCLCCRCECVGCAVRASLETLPSLRELCLVGASPRVASAPGIPCDWPLSSSIHSTASAQLRTLRLKDCSFAAGDFARVLARPLERLELPHCTGIDARTLADAILVSGVELRHLAIEAPASRSPQASPPSSPTLSARSTTSSPADSLVGTLLPYLEKLTSLRVVGDVLDEVDLAKLARQLPALRSLHLDSNPRLSLSDLVPLLSPTSSTRLPHLSYLHFQPADPASVGDLCLEPPLCLESPAEEQQRNSAIVEDLWRTASETNVELVGLPFREIRDRFDWAAKEVAKVRSCEDSSRSKFGSPARRRKRPSLASA